MKLLAIRNAARRTLENSTAHGLPNIVSSEAWHLKLVWLLFSLLSTAGCGYLIFISIQAYLNYDVVSQIRINRQVPMQFPSVKLCNINFIANKASAEKLIEIKKMMQISDEEALNMYDFFFQYYLASQINSVNMSDEEKMSLGLSWDQFFISCKFNSKRCNETMFEWTFDTRYGICHVFNPNGTLKSSKPGNLNGLEVQLYIPRPPDFFTAYTSTLGAQVTVFNSSQTTDIADGFIVSVDTDTRVSLSRTISRRLPYPYSDCVQDLASYNSDLVDYFVQNEVSYTQKQCYQYCYQRFVARNCSCLADLSNQFNPGGIPYCATSYPMFKCSMDRFASFFEGLELQDECVDDCPIECESISYGMETSFGYFPVDNYYHEQLNRSSTLALELFNMTQAEIRVAIDSGKLSLDTIAQTMKKKTLSLKIYYEDLTYTLLEETAKLEVIDLLSNLGAQCGLFLGISFLSLVELLDLAIRVLLILCDKKISKVEASINDGFSTY